MKQITTISMDPSVYEAKKKSGMTWNQVIILGLKSKTDYETEKLNSQLAELVRTSDLKILELERKNEALAMQLDRALREMDALKAGKDFINNEERAA